MVVSGFSVRRRAPPGWPGCPPVCLPDGCRRLPTRGGFFNPSLDGGLPLLPLFSPTWRSNSAIRSRSAAISAAWRVSCASNSSIRSPFVSLLRAVRSIVSLNRQPGAASNKIYADIVATRSSIVPRPVLTGTPLAVIYLGSNEGDRTDAGHHARPLADPAAILAQCHVADVVVAVLDAPVGADDLRQALTACLKRSEHHKLLGPSRPA